jgi:hypothetical protein
VSTTRARSDQNANIRGQRTVNNPVVPRSTSKLTIGPYPPKEKETQLHLKGGEVSFFWQKEDSGNYITTHSGTCDLIVPPGVAIRVNGGEVEWDD